MFPGKCRREFKSCTRIERHQTKALPQIAAWRSFISRTVVMVGNQSSVVGGPLSTLYLNAATEYRPLPDLH